MTDSITGALKQRVVDDMKASEDALLHGYCKSMEDYNYHSGALNAYRRVLNQIDDIAKLVEELD